jgi:hypothetical protein
MNMTGTTQVWRAHTVEPDPAKASWLEALRGWERHLTLAAVDEAIRLLESEQFEKLTDQHVRCIAEYGAITIDDESFFDKAFSTGKEVAACLACARDAGPAAVLEDLASLRATLLGRSLAPAPPLASTLAAANHGPA